MEKRVSGASKACIAIACLVMVLTMMAWAQQKTGDAPGKTTATNPTTATSVPVVADKFPATAGTATQPTNTVATTGPAAEPGDSPVAHHIPMTGPVLPIATNAPPKEDGQWTMPSKYYSQTRYSGLDEINTQNVKNLKCAWTFSTGVNRGQEAAPIVVNNSMYIVTGYPNICYALDLTKANSNETMLKWKYEPHPASASQGVACCDLVCRGCVYSEGKLYYNLLDDHTVCVDANTGKEIWRCKLGDFTTGESITMAPLVVKDKVYVGNSGGEFGVRGWLTAINKNDGKIAWRAWSTGPDSDVLIGSRFKPFYDFLKGKDLGLKSWPADMWKIGGGNVWGWVSYDPESNLIYYGTGNPGSWNPELRPGDNQWSAGAFARDADTGEAIWFYQYTPHDLYDHDEINEHIILDLPIKGQTRKVVVHPARNGYMYIIDRLTGEVLSYEPYVRVNAAKGVDLKSGRLIPNEMKKPQVGKVIRDISPASPGGKDWQPCAYSYNTGLLYVPHQNLACDYEAVDTSYIEGTPYVGVNEKMYAGKDDPDKLGYFDAWDLINNKLVWRIKEKFPCWSGTVATAGDVVFYGTMDGWFKALNARTGQELWKFKCASGVIGQPVTYRGPDGKQYVAVLSGVGGWAGVVVDGDLDPRDPSAALGFVNATRDLPKYTTKGGVLYVFSL